MSEPTNTPPPLPSSVVATPLSSAKKSGCLLQVLLMNPIWTGVGGLAALVAIVVPFMIPDKAGSVSSLHDNIAQKHAHYPHTLEYWNQWSAARKQHDDAVNPLREAEFPEHALKCAEWDYWLANTTASIPQVGVDPELSQLAIEFVSFYQTRAQSWNFQAVLMQTAKIIQDRGEMTAEDVDSYMKWALSNPLELTTDEFNPNERLKKAREDLFRSMRATNEQYTVLRIKRDQLRARLIGEYKQELSW